MVKQVQQTKAPLITSDMLISEVVEKYPQAGVILSGYGLGCVGCGASGFETIEAGATGHGFDKEMVEMMLKDVNEIAEIQNKEKDDSPLQITKEAALAIKKFKEKSGKGEYDLRISIMDGGCSGKSYKFRLDKKNKEDKFIEKNGERILLDKEAFEALKGGKIDYIESLEGSGFKVYNPNAHHTCGCGSSFNLNE